MIHSMTDPLFATALSGPVRRVSFIIEVGFELLLFLALLILDSIEIRIHLGHMALIQIQSNHTSIRCRSAQFDKNGCIHDVLGKVIWTFVDRAYQFDPFVWIQYQPN